MPQLEQEFQTRLAASRAVPSPPRQEPTADEHRLYQYLTWEGVHIDDLIEQSGLSSAAVSGLLLTLELKGLLRSLPGHFYVRL